MTNTDGYPISFETTKAEVRLITKILDRAAKQKLFIGDRMDHMMDIQACHANGTPLDFQKFLDADDFNFLHDFCGIYRHINRATGKLEDMFLPRTAKKEMQVEGAKS